MTATGATLTLDFRTGSGIIVLWLENNEERVLRRLKMRLETFYAVYNNSDLNEGRGQQYIWAVCRERDTAVKVGKGQCVMGSDCLVKEVKGFVADDGKLYFPKDGYSIYEEPPNEQDLLDKLKDSKLFSDKELNFLMSKFDE